MVKLLAEKYGGVLCEENYHDQLLPELDKTEFPCLTYTCDLEDWHDFIRRSPEEYKAWMDGVSDECEILELRILDGLKDQDRPVFVDTNISIETLKSITPADHVLVMLADPQISVRRFFGLPGKAYSDIPSGRRTRAALPLFRQTACCGEQPSYA